MMMYIRPFNQWEGLSTVNLAVGTTSSNVAIPAPNIGWRSIRLVNLGTDVVFFQLGATSAVTASASTSIPLLPNSSEVFLLPNDIAYVAAIGQSGGNTLYISVGDGI